MTVPHNAVRRAVHAALADHAPLQDLVPNVMRDINTYIDVLSRVPFVLISNIESQTLTTQTDAVYEFQVSCDFYSEKLGGNEAREGIECIADALAQPLSISGCRVILQQGGAAGVDALADGKSYRGRYQLRLIVENV